MSRDNIAEFVKLGITPITMPVSELTTLVMSTFLKILKRLPSTTPRCFDSPLPQLHHATFLEPASPGLGLIFFPQDFPREKNRRDSKVILYYRPELEEVWRTHNPLLYQTCRKLLRYCRRLYLHCTRRLERFGKQFDKRVHGFDIARGIYSKRNVLRIVAYVKIRPQHKKERVIDPPHFDHSSLTLALAESHDGFEYLDQTSHPVVWRTISSQPNRPLIFRGRKDR